MKSSEQTLFDAIQPAPVALHDVLTRLEAELGQLGFFQVQSPPTTAMYTHECFDDGTHQGRLLVVAMAYVEREATTSQKQKLAVAKPQKTRRAKGGKGHV